MSATGNYVYVCTLFAKRIPRGWVIDRTCRNPRCYDPKHMRLVPPKAVP